MIPISAVKDAATILGVALPVLIEALKAVKCAVEDCDVVMLPADAPDLLTQSVENRNDLARRATSTDRVSIDSYRTSGTGNATIDAAFAHPSPMATSIHRGDSDEVLPPRAPPPMLIHAARPMGPPCGARHRGGVVMSTLTDENVTCDECAAALVYGDG